MLLMPMMTWADEIVRIYGDINLKPGGTTVLTASPDNASYTYCWEFDLEMEKLEQQWNVVVNDNQLTVRHLGLGETGVLTVWCTVYDANGNYVGFEEVQVVILPWMYWN